MLLLSSMWWGSSHSPQSSWDDERRGGQWQQEPYESPPGKKDKEKGQDRFKNVVSLGVASKRLLPLEDRKALLIAVMHELSPQKNVVSKIAVANWTGMTTHAMLYLLSRVTPRTPIRILRDSDNVFTIDYAAKTLAETALTLYGQQEALADPRWVRGAPGFRFDSDLAQDWFRFDSDLVQIWFRFGPNLVQIWFRFGSGLDQIWFIFGSALDRMWFGCGMGWV